MELKHISQIIELYGVERVLEDHYMTMPEVLDILDELGFIDLDNYEEDTYE